MWPTAGFVRTVLFLGLLSVLLTVGFASPASAEQTTVSVEVCQAGAASLHIINPASDSLHSQPDITVAGDVSNVTQVEIYIDGDYTRTAAVAQDSDQFQSSITLAPGTHTIRASGIALCGGSAVEDEVVVTYQPTIPGSSGSSPGTHTDNGIQPVTPPSYGSELPTVINPELPRGSDDEVVNTTESSTQNADVEGKLSYFERLWRTISGFRLGQRSGADTNQVATFQSMSIVWLRGSGIVIGSVFLAFGRRLVSFVERVRNSIAGRWRLIDISIRGLGLCLIIVSLAFV